MAECRVCSETRRLQSVCPVRETLVSPSCPPDGASADGPETEGHLSSSGDVITVTIGATVPTGFEHTAAEEIKEKIGADARISRPSCSQVHLLRSVDNLFVVVEEFHQYQFKESKEETLTELQQLASNSPGPTPWRGAAELLQPAPPAEGQSQEDTTVTETQDSEDTAPEAKLISSCFLNIPNEDVVLHRPHRGESSQENIITSDPTTLRSTLCYGMLR
ncbi:hypothetical protein INR49_005729 [Caranx melampygus]|nr:hypothetical protein INR49_005729 [Caranx melampygus]